MASNVTGIIDNTGIYVKTANLNIAKQSALALKLPDSHLNVLKVCLRYISFRAWGQGERASNSCGQTLDIYHARWPETETGSILIELCPRSV